MRDRIPRRVEGEISPPPSRSLSGQSRLLNTIVHVSPHVMPGPLLPMK
jgi:hypothetical protein